MTSAFTDRLKACVPKGTLLTEEPMSRHTTFRVGGPAGWYAEPADVKELADVTALCRESQVACYIIGNGSNLLVSDEGFCGVIAALGKTWSEITVQDNTIRAGAGAMLSSATRMAQMQGLTGMEGLSGIPGTVGGAVVMNAGAYGSEMKDVLRSVKVLTPEGEVLTLTAGELGMGYRTSCIPKHGYIVLEAELELEKGSAEAIRARMEELAVQRRIKQPLEYPSAGSTFKRPEGYFAGRLIQDAGLRGFTVGGAQVSEKHCGFVINRGGATAADLYSLCRQVRAKVKQTFGVELELEVKLLGNFSQEI